MPFVSRTRAILRRAELGFLGVIVRTCRQTPRFWGAPGIGTWRWRRLFQFLRIAGALILVILVRRPLRTSWLIVGTKTLLLSVVLGRFAARRRRPLDRGRDPRLSAAANRATRARRWSRRTPKPMSGRSRERGV